MKRILRIGLALAVLAWLTLLAGPLVIPLPPIPGAVPPTQLADPDSRFADIPGLRVHYKLVGAPAPAASGKSALVLLHGFAASEFSWREVMAPLSRYGLAIAFDRPAFGLTERPMPGDWSTQNPYSPQAQVTWTVGLLDHLGIQQAVLIGNSAGGAIAMHTALRHPDRVRALVLVDPAIYHPGGSLSWIQPVLGSPQMRWYGPLLLRLVIPTWGQEFGRSAWHDPTRITPAIWAGYTRPLQVQNWDRGLWEFLLSSENLDLAARLGQVQAPTLVITGDDDRIVPPAQSARLAGELPNARLVVIPNCGHVPHEECPTAFLQAVIEFLAMLP